MKWDFVIGNLAKLVFESRIGKTEEEKRRMRGGKDDEKARSPLFPRLHVSHTEKGGPRAPPRNKMALYEQLSIPSQRFIAVSGSMLPLQPKYHSSFVPSVSSNHLGDADYLKVATSTQFGIAPSCCSGQQYKETEKIPHMPLSASLRLQTASERQRKGNGTTDMKTREYARNQAEENARVSQSCQNPSGRSASILSARDNVLGDASSSPSTEVESAELVKQPHRSLNRECLAIQDKMVFRCDLLVESVGGIGGENAARSESCIRKSCRDHNGSLNRPEDGSECHEDKKYGSVGAGVLVRCDDVSDASMADSLPALNISPDDVLEVIGEKLFWKARKAIANQQRVFAVQVFELHRVIKVQRLMAGSPHQLLEDQLQMGKTTLGSPVKKLPTVVEPQLALKSTHSQELHPRAVYADENTVTKLQLPSVHDNTSKELVAHPCNSGPYSGDVASMPMPPNSKPSQWCFPHPGSQWLVPVMSPSEGLVYKPYLGLCPPTAGFMAPVYGSYYPISLKPDGFPASHQPGVDQTCFPPFGFLHMSTTISSSAIEEMSPSAGGQSKDNRLLIDAIEVVAHRSERNMSNQMSEVIPSYVRKLQMSEESEMQGSSASSPSENAKGDALALFPTKPTMQAFHQNAQSREQRTRVIKVVPHNSRLATESAARIFQSIQDERKQY